MSVLLSLQDESAGLAATIEALAADCGAEGDDSPHVSGSCNEIPTDGSPSVSFWSSNAESCLCYRSASARLLVPEDIQTCFGVVAFSRSLF